MLNPSYQLGKVWVPENYLICMKQLQNCEILQVKNSSYVCELCQRNGKVCVPVDVSEKTSEALAGDVDSGVDQARNSPSLLSSNGKILVFKL